MKKWSGGYQGMGLYQHRKGGMYRVFGVGRNKRTGERYVIYETLDRIGSRSSDDDFWAREFDDFGDVVDGKPRFLRVS